MLIVQRSGVCQLLVRVELENRVLLVVAVLHLPRAATGLDHLVLPHLSLKAHPRCESEQDEAGNS
jgi:hypothetical protein